MRTIRFPRMTVLPLLPIMVLIFMLVSFPVDSDSFASSTTLEQKIPETLVEYHQNLLTIECVNAPVGVLLGKIANTTGIRIIVKGPIDQPVSISLSALPIEKVVRRLFPGINVAFKYHAKSHENHPMLSDILIVHEGSEENRNILLGNLEVFSTDGTEDAVGLNDSGGMELIAPPEVPEISEIEAVLLKDQDPNACATSLQMLRYISMDQSQMATELLIQAMKDGNSDVRLAAIDVLGTMTNETAAAGMVKAMNDPSPDVRAASVMRVGALGLIPPEDILAHGLKDTDPRVRAVSIEAIANMESTEMVPLLTLALKDPDVSVREAASQAAERLEGKGLLSEAASGIEGEINSTQKIEMGKMVDVVEETGVAEVPIPDTGVPINSEILEYPEISANVDGLE